MATKNKFFSFSSFWLLIFNAAGGYLICIFAMNIIKYTSVNLIISEVGLGGACKIDDPYQ